MNTKTVVRHILAAEFVLLVPLVGMLLSNEVDWDARDFVIGAVLLAGLGFAFSLVMNKTSNVKQIAIGMVTAAIIVLIWAELAVGIFSSPFAGS